MTLPPATPIEQEKNFLFALADAQYLYRKPEKIADALDRANASLDRNGWCKGDFLTEDGKECAVGALFDVLVEDLELPENQVSPAYLTFMRRETHDDMYVPLLPVMAALVRNLSPRMFSSIMASPWLAKLTDKQEWTRNLASNLAGAIWCFNDDQGDEQGPLVIRELFKTTADKVRTGEITHNYLKVSP